MRSMAHPDYKYKPWTKERREAASAAARKRAAEARTLQIARMMRVQAVNGRVDISAALLDHLIELAEK